MTTFRNFYAVAIVTYVGLAYKTCANLVTSTTRLTDAEAIEMAKGQMKEKFGPHAMDDVCGTSVARLEDYPPREEITSVS